MDLRAIAGFALDEAVSQDASFFNGVKRFMVDQPGKKKGEGKPTDLTSHDNRFHSDGFQKGDACKYRDNLDKDDYEDSIEDSPNAGMLPKGVSVEACDITKQDVDAIVNAANRWMLGGGGVDGAIHRAAGPSLVEECRKYPADKNGFRVQTGEAKITGAGNLPAKHVIHTAGPDVRDFARLPIGDPTDMFGKFAGAADWDTVSEEDKKELARLLSNSYKNSLELAKENGCKSVAFPSISTGIFGYPVEEAAKTVSDTVGKFLKENPDMSVKMCIFDPNPQKQAQIIKAYEDAFASQNPKEQVVSDVEFDWDESTKEVNWGDGEVKVVGDGTRPILNNHDNMASLRKEVVEKSKDNIRRQHNYIGDSAQGQPQMLVDGKVYRFTASLAKHGLTVRNCSDNGSAAAIIGDIINNSVEVPKTPDGITYRIGMVDFGEPCAVLVSCFKSSSFDDVEDVVEVELMHSVNTKRGNATPGFIPSISSQSTISISQLRELWQRCFLEGVKNLKNKHRHEEPVQDEDDYSSGVKATTDLQKHDAKYHPNGYKQGDSCQYRDKLDKGDSVDDLDPENVDGENAPTDKATSAENASSVPAAFTNAENAVKNAIADIEGGNLSGVAGLAKLLDDYENEYGNVTGGAGAVKTIGGLLAKCKSQNGIMAQIYQKHMNALKAAAASSALPKGTKTPQDMRNEAATKIASALGAQLAQSKPTAVSKNAASAAGAQGATVQPNQATANAQVQSTQPQTPPAPPAPPQYGPAASLPHNFTALPAGMNLDNFASWPRGGGSTGLRIYTDPNTGKKYGVKRSDGMPQGQNITKDVLLEDYLADQTLRIAGLDAPDGLLQVNPNDGRLYKVTEWHDNTSGIGSGSPSMNTQLAEAYPMMAMTYNMDASQNGDNILVDKITGKLVFVDNGSSFGNRAQGARNAWFDSRTEADSTKDHKGVAQLASHGSQSMWANALGLPNISGRYDQHISSQDQDVILKQFAKYDMGGIASEVSRLRDGLYKSLGLTKPTKADAKFKNIETWAKSADALSAKFKTAKAPTGVGSQQGNKSQSQTVSPAQPQPQPSPQPATTHQGDIDLAMRNLSSLPQQPTNVTGNFSCYNNQLTSLQGAPQTVGGGFSCSFNKLTSLQGAPQSVGGDFSCHGNQLTSLDGAPVKVGGKCDFSINPGLTQKQINDYLAFLKNPDPSHIDSTGHYVEKAIPKAQQGGQSANQAVSQPSATNWLTGQSVANAIRNAGSYNPSWIGAGRTQRNSTAIQNAVANMSGLSQASVNALAQMFTQGTFTPNGRGVGGVITGLSIPSVGRYALQQNLNQAFASQGLKIQIHNGGNTVSIGASNRSIANQALSATGNQVSNPTPAPASSPSQTTSASSPSSTQNTQQPSQASSSTTASSANATTTSQTQAAHWASVNQLMSAPTTNSSWNSTTGKNQSRNATAILQAMASAPSTSINITNAFSNMLKGSFAANGKGIGGTITGCSIPTKGIQALNKAINAHMNPLGYKVQIHNGGTSVTFTASNRSIANQALSATGNNVSHPVPSASSTASATSAAQPSAPQAQSSTTPAGASNVAQPTQAQQPASKPTSGNKGWQSTINSTVNGKASQQIKNAYNGVANWLNQAGV